MLDCRSGILELSGSLSRVSHMEVIMLYRYILASSLSDIHFHTSMMNYLGFIFVSWVSYFSIFSSEEVEMAG